MPAKTLPGGNMFKSKNRMMDDKKVKVKANVNQHIRPQKLVKPRRRG